MERKSIMRYFIAFTSAMHLFCFGGNIDYCSGKLPHNVKGLSVNGPRPRQNVIENMAKIICSWRTGCIENKRTDLEGIVTVKLTVNHSGKIGIDGYTSNIKDSVFIEAMVESLSLYDFDPWNDGLEPTKIEYPMVLFP
jgi:hypothetical protein